ncbi:class F sortase [Catellatospora sp. IY07-71]|uniref:class F sortase n=1 Tax=Catellatospora sp. IY07-71 TaxID=2728827 RepID=UPI001BB3E395|nr:class F sortase [Catellatospora sp. IY07-71]BCJ75776.1 class F sortase [Catellatospora sp. IY07-71]
MTAPRPNGAPRDTRGARRPGLTRREALPLIGAAFLLTAAGCRAAEDPEPVLDALAGASPSPSAAGPDAAVPVRAGSLPAAVTAIPPVRLRIPAMSLDARVDPVGIDASTGDFAVPPSVDRVGWYRYGPGLEATEGSIVIAGHVDSAAQGKGAFFGLRDLDARDTVQLADASGDVMDLRVVAVEQFRKTRIPLERYFARDGAVRLTLITCGGPFDRATRHYRDNIVVTAARS